MKKLILSAVPAVIALCALVGCGGNDGKFDAKKLSVTGADATVNAELGTRYVIPVPEVKYGKEPQTVTFEVLNSAGQQVELVARGTRFYVSEVSDYKINYFITYAGEKRLVASSAVSVADTQGPEIILPASAYSMTVYKDSTVEIPVPTVRDASGKVASQGYKVTYKDAEVTVTKGEGENPDTFVPTEYGEYVIEYSATDESNNTTLEPVTVNCARMVTLCDFESSATDSWTGNGDPAGYVTDHVFSGEKALKATSNGDTDYVMIAAYIPYMDLSGFDSFAINVWSSRDCTASNDGFYLLNQVYRLKEGDNIILIDRDAFASQYPGCKIPNTTRPDYANMEYVYFQICGNNLEVVVDNFVGIYANYETDTAKPNIDFGRTNYKGEITVNDKKAIRVPNVFVYDNSFETITADYTVKKADGTDITKAVKDGTFRAAVGDGHYVITYTATDPSGNTATRDMKVNVRVLEVPAGNDLPTDRKYDMLQDFEGGIDVSANVEANRVTMTHGTEYARVGNAIHVSAPNADWSAFKIKLLKNGVRLTADDFEEYDYVQLSVVCDSDDISFYMYGTEFILKAGLNKIKISGADMAKMITASPASYNENAWFWAQLRLQAGKEEYNLYFDQFIGVYPEEIPDEAPFDKAKLVVTGLEAEQTVELNENYSPVIPAVKYNGIARKVSFKVFDSEDAEVTVTNKKFQITSMQGYTIKYYIPFLEGEQEVATATVTVNDNNGPEVNVTALPVVEKGSTVSFTVSATDLSGVKSTSVKVTLKGAEIPVTKGESGAPDTFVASEYGEYVITCTAEDNRGNQSTATYTVSCAKSILLCGFENGNDSWTNGGSYVTEHVASGNGLKAPASGNVSVYMDPFYDVSGFDKFVVHVWAKESRENGFYIQAHAYNLKAGNNLIVMTREEMLAQYANGMANVDNNGRPYIFFQVIGVEAVVDHFIGIFDNYETDTVAPTFDLGRKYRSGSMELEHGKVLVVPGISDFNVYDNSLEACTLEYVVKKTDGTDITAEVKAGTFKADFADVKYVITLTAKDASNNVSVSRMITVNVPKPEERRFDVLQSFETGMESSVSVAGTVEVTEEHAVDGNCVKWTTSTDWQKLTINMKKNGAALTTEDFSAYEYLQFNIWCDKDGATLYFLNGSIATLNAGENVVKVPIATVLAQIEASKNNEDDAFKAYRADGWSFWQIGNGSGTYTLYLDNLIGVYPAE